MLILSAIANFLCSMYFIVQFFELNKSYSNGAISSICFYLFIACIANGIIAIGSFLKNREKNKEMKEINDKFKQFEFEIKELKRQKKDGE